MDTTQDYVTPSLSTREIVLLEPLERPRHPRRSRYNAPSKGILLGGALVLIFLIVGGSFFALCGRVEMPSVIGLSQGVARIRLEQIGISSLKIQQRYSGRPAGSVIGQSPRAGSTVHTSSAVHLIISGGAATFFVPDVMGDNQIYAQRALSNKGLIPVIIEEPSDDTPGKVIAMSPMPGSKVTTGDSVTLHVAAQREQIALKEYRLAGKSIVLDPAPVPTGFSDVTYDVAQRTASLLQAAGAKVVITRGAAGTRRDKPTSAQAYVRFDVRKTGTNGVIVQHPDNLSSLALKTSLAQETLTMLNDYSFNVRSGTDSIASPTTARARMALSLGAVDDATDQAQLSDAKLKDNLARIVYLSLGTYLTH